MEDWVIFTETFLLGAFPWVSELKQLKIHFEVQNFRIQSIYNFFASLFSVSIFILLNRLGIFELLYWPNWGWFIASAFFATIIYFSIFYYMKPQVENQTVKWPVIANFVLYVFIFCSLTTGFGLLQIYKDHFVISGTIMDESGNPIPYANVIIDDLGTVNLKETESDDFGRFAFEIKKTKVDNFNHILIQKQGYQKFDKHFIDISALKSICRNIILKNNEIR